MFRNYFVYNWKNKEPRYIMIFFNKSFGKRFALIALYYFFIVFIILLFDESELWNGFTDRFLVYQFSIVFLIGKAGIDNYFNYYVTSRLGTRKQAILNHTLYDLFYTVMVVSAVFIFFMFFSVLIKGKNYVDSIYLLVDCYFRYLLTAFLLTNISRNFLHAKINIFRKYSQLCAYLILVVDVLILYPMVHRVVGQNEIQFLFSWTLAENNILSYVILGVWNILLFFYLYRRCEQEDLL